MALKQANYRRTFISSGEISPARNTPERQSLMNSHRQSPLIKIESTTTGRAGGMRKAPKRSLIKKISNLS
jgi:hypothetical protein